MNIKVIKRPIPEEICEDGGASVVIVGKETVDLETSIDEAKDVLIVVGDKLLVKGIFVGLFTSMVKGIERDGNARQLGDFITLYPVPTGEFDLDKGWQPGVNGVRIRARLMNELEIDVSNWEFEDVTPGRQAFTLGSIECGEHQLGVVDFVHPVWINGKPLPRTDEIRVDWAVEGTDRHGTVAADKVTSTASRATLAADALAEIATAEYDGKTVVFTVRGNFASAKISATLKYALPDPTYPITSEDGKFTLDEPTAERPSADALNCTFEIVEGLGELYPAVGLAGTKLSKSLVSAEGGVACTSCNIDETYPSLLHVKFGAHDAQVGDKRYVHLTYAEGKTVVLPVTVTEEA